jgi:hypothetical protein
MSSSCCYLVGNFDELSLSNCIISVNNNINTAFSYQGCSNSGGVRIGTINISGYADTQPFSGCPGRAGAAVSWLRKFDCENNEVHFIYTGQGRSFSSGGANSFVSLDTTFGDSSSIMSASAQSGPMSLYQSYTQIEGMGLSYSGPPISFNTSSKSGCVVGNMGIGTGEYYLQNFNLEVVPGSIPVASYTFVYRP